MVKPIIEYAAVVWAPHTKRDIDMIERTQRQAARFVTSNYSRYASVTQMLTDLNWPTLAPALKPGRVIRVTFSPGHPGLTRFTIYPGLTRIGSREKRNCSFDDVETYKRYRVALS